MAPKKRIPSKFPGAVRAPQHKVGRFAESQKGDVDALPGIMAAISSVSIWDDES